MNPPEPIELTRSQLLMVDELGDQLESSIRKHARFDVDSFLLTIKDPLVQSAVRKEWEFLRSSFASAKTVTGYSQNRETLAEQVRSFEAGSKIDDFELVKRIGKGATAVVWKAKSLTLDRSVALKFPTVYSPAMASRLKRESKAVARLQHPNIASIYEIRFQDKGAYLVSELVEGSSLTEKLQPEGLDPTSAINLLLPVVEAIAYSHSMNVIHRDLKPQNVLVRTDGTPVVVDFGLARILQSEMIVLTQEGDFIGTPGYMSPEQTTGTRDIDERIDVYSLGVMLFQMLTGQLPFGGDLQSVLHKIVNEPAPLPSMLNPKVSKDLDTICSKCLEKDPESRFRSAQQLAMELRRVLDGEPILSRPVSSFEKMARWAKNKPIEASLAGLLLASIVTLATGATVFALQMKRRSEDEIALRLKAQDAERKAVKLSEEVKAAFNRAQLQSEIARAEAFENESSVNFLKSVFQDSNPAMWVFKGDGIGSGKPPTIKQLFKNAADRLKHEYTGNDQSKANLMEMLADSCRSVGDMDLSRELLASAKTIRDSISDYRSIDGVDPTIEHKFAMTHNRFLFARLEHDCGRFQLAESIYNQCLDDLSNLNRTDRVDKLIAETAFHLGRLQLSMHNNALAKSQFSLAIAKFDALEMSDSFLAKACNVGLEFCDLGPGEIPSTVELAKYFKEDSWARRVFHCYSRVLFARAKGELNSATSSYRELLDTMRERLEDDNQWYLLALGDYAGLQLKAGHLEEAYRAAKLAIAKGETIAPDHPQLLEAKRSIGKVLCRSGELETAYRYLKSVHDVKHKQGSEQVDKDLYFELIQCCYSLDRREEAEGYLEDLVSGETWHAGPEKVWVAFLESRVFEESDVKRSKRSFDEALTILESMHEAPKNGIWCDRMAKVLMTDAQYDRAIYFAKAGVKYDAQKFFADHPRVSNRRMLLGKLYLLDGQREQAREQFKLALTIRRRFLSPNNRLVTEAHESVAALSQQ